MRAPPTATGGSRSRGGRPLPEPAPGPARHAGAGSRRREHAARDDGPAGRRDAARRSRSAGAAGPPAGRRARADPARALSTAAATAPGWFRASGDARIGPALQALHANPSHPWTVAELAEPALLSRSAFARTFTEQVGVAPLHYLNDWRMALARERLRDSDARLASIGAALGYSSEFSFAAASKRHHGTPQVAGGARRVAEPS